MSGPNPFSDVYIQAKCVYYTFIGKLLLTLCHSFLNPRFLKVTIQVLRQVPHSSKLEWKTFSRFDQVQIIKVNMLVDALGTPTLEVTPVSEWGSESVSNVYSCHSVTSTEHCTTIVLYNRILNNFF